MPSTPSLPSLIPPQTRSGRQYSSHLRIDTDLKFGGLLQEAMARAEAAWDEPDSPNAPPFPEGLPSPISPPATLPTEVQDEWDAPLTPIESESERAPSPLDRVPAPQAQVASTQGLSIAKPSAVDMSKQKEYRDRKHANKKRARDSLPKQEALERRKRRAVAKKARMKRRHVQEQEDQDPFSKAHSRTARWPIPLEVDTNGDVSQYSVTRGAYTASRMEPIRDRPWTRKELLNRGFRYIEWDGWFVVSDSNMAHG